MYIFIVQESINDSTKGDAKRGGGQLVRLIASCPKLLKSVSFQLDVMFLKQSYNAC